MDAFFTKKNCDKCGGTLAGGRIMSAFSEDCICIICKDKERQDKDYDRAVEVDHEQIRQGNYNFEGIKTVAIAESHITDKIIKQILVIRAEGKFNMFSVADIQREAFEKGFNELVIFLEDHKKEYANFILTGQK